EFPDDLATYDLVVHCGGCMLNEREMAHRMRVAAEAGVPMVNYGVAIAQMNGILDRSLEPLDL
ncbi:MAG: [FeFe] hydrogenase H-cluster maturation GTPase HydF, partial [Coriobacteriaceae bacterium]|nr:[FeFe] hydrogenase H-cluster maturation GTPase HydF [Coriobacteriaceae bacterium]